MSINDKLNLAQERATSGFFSADTRQLNIEITQLSTVQVDMTFLLPDS